MKKTAEIMDVSAVSFALELMPARCGRLHRAASAPLPGPAWKEGAYDQRADRSIKRQIVGILKTLNARSTHRLEGG